MGAGSWKRCILGVQGAPSSLINQLPQGLSFTPPPPPLSLAADSSFLRSFCLNLLLPPLPKTLLGNLSTFFQVFLGSLGSVSELGQCFNTPSWVERLDTIAAITLPLEVTPNLHFFHLGTRALEVGDFLGEWLKPLLHQPVG